MGQPIKKLDSRKSEKDPESISVQHAPGFFVFARQGSNSQSLQGLDPGKGCVAKNWE